MHTTPTPEPAATADAEPSITAAASASCTVPASGPAPGVVPAPAPPVDPSGGPDPYAEARAAAVENLLRCWARETDARAPDDGHLAVPLPSSGTALSVPVLYWSPTGWHRFGAPRLADAPAPACAP